jgi:hypothetical protein
VVASSFRAVIQIDGINPYIGIPARVLNALTGQALRSRVRVAGRLNGHSFHATVLHTADGRHRLYVWDN